MLKQLLALTVLLSCVCVATFAQTPPPNPSSLAGAESHVYKTVGETKLYLHVFRPADKSAKKLPAIVFFFGGGWTNGTVTQFVKHSEH